MTEKSKFRPRNLIAAGVVACGLALLAACTPPEEKAQEYLRNAQSLFEDGNYSDARLEFRNALQINEDLADAWYGLAMIAEKNGNWRQSYKYLNRVVQLDPNRADAQIRIGKVLLAARQLDKALETSNKVQEIAPDDLAGKAFRAAVLFKLDDRDGAVKLAEDVLAHEPDNMDALVVMASHSHTEGDLRGAVAYLDRGLAKDERNIAFYLLKLRILAELEDSGGQEATLKRMVELFPDNNAVRKSLARFYFANKRQGGAERILRDIAAAEPDDMDLKMDVVRFVHAVRGFEAAEQELKSMIVAFPQMNDLKFALSDLYVAAGKLDQAETVLRQEIGARGTTPHGLTARNRLAGLRLAAKDVAGAQALVDEVLANDARNGDALIIRGSIEIDAGNTDAAVGDLRTVLRDTPDSVRALMLLGRAHLRAGSPQLAEDQYVQAFRVSNNAAGPGLEYARFLIANRRLDDSEDILQKVLGRDSGNVMALRMLAQVRLGLRDYAGAEQVAEDLRARGGENAAVRQIMGIAQAGQEKVDESIESFRRAHELAPGASRPIASLVQAYMRQDRPDDADKFLDAVIESSPDNLVAWILKGQLAQARDRTEDAAGYYRKAIELRPDANAGYRYLAGLLVRTGQFEEAEAVVREGLSANAESVELLLLMASLQERQDNTSGAIATYRKLLDVNPRINVAANNLASLISDASPSDPAALAEARDWAARFGDSEVPHFRDTLGWIEYRLGNYDAAVSNLRAAATRMPGAPVFRYHLGMAYMKAGRIEAARAELQKAIELGAEAPFDQMAAAQEALQGLPATPSGAASEPAPAPRQQ